MVHAQRLLFVAAATLVSGALLVPTSSVSAQNWTTVGSEGNWTTVRNDGNWPMIVGSGRVAGQARNLAPFRNIETIGSEHVDIRFGATQSVTISADDNLLNSITTEVHGGTLKIGSRGSFRTRSPIWVTIVVPALDSFTGVGSGNLAIHDVRHDRLALNMKGSGAVTANGSLGSLDLSLYGSGRANLADLVADRANASIYGSGSAEVRATQRLDASVFGSGSLRIVGSPQVVNRENHGSGRIIG